MYSVWTAADLPVICVETRHMKALFNLRRDFA
jgi:hypothetical protein